ncbi:MAG: glycoside hydrolase family 127 protein [Phycisphaerae bacterium]|nr:glycoside hydrolase family 127 protein [Phycisphaerae bacterium]
MTPFFWVAGVRADLPAETLGPEPIALADQKPGGELRARLMKNFDRLEEEKYQPHRVFLTNQESNHWPGDTEGRTVLALTLLGQATGRAPRHLDTILDLLPERMNSRGYFGDIAGESVADEQQLASHGWVLCSLCEHYQWSRDPATLELIRGVMKGLVLPARGRFERYPIDPGRREHGGSYSGSLSSRPVDNWFLSTDTGCVLILLDGVVQAYAIEPSPELKTVIDEMIALLDRIDFREVKAQTHATLTGARGLLRYYALTGDTALLKKAQDIFAIYTRHGMTETYENYNWFGRPMHTEPCAVVDAFMVAMELWRLTARPDYLETAHHIYYNGLCAEQRANGGFGCNSCAGADSSGLKVKLDEAHWCCTMRGAEGLARVAQAAYFTLDDSVFVTFYADNEASLRLGNRHLWIRQRSRYPFAGESTIDIQVSSPEQDISLRLFAPSFAENYRVQVNGAPVETSVDHGFVVVPLRPRSGDTVRLTFDLATRWAEPVNAHTIPGLATVRYGPLVLASLDADARVPPDLVVRHTQLNHFDCSGVPMVSVYHLMDATIRETGPERRILFARDGS